MASASPKTATATALQKSASRPCHLPLSSGAENPGNPCVTPHISTLRFLTRSSVPSAFAGVKIANTGNNKNVKNTPAFGYPICGHFKKFMIFFFLKIKGNCRVINSYINKQAKPSHKAQYLRFQMRFIKILRGF